MNPIIVEWDVNLNQCSSTRGVASARYDSTFVELQILARGGERHIDVYIVIQSKIEVPSVLTTSGM